MNIHPADIGRTGRLAVFELKQLPVSAETVVKLLLGLSLLLAFWPADSHGASTRTLDIKKKIIVRSQQVKLEDVVSNYDILTEKERVLVIMDAPTAREGKTVTIVQLAYMLQKFPELMDAELDGPRSITIEPEKDAPIDNQHVARAKSEIINHLKSTDPWREWKIDVLINTEDVKKISSVGDFITLKVINLDRTAMLGSVSLRVAFLDAKEQKIGEVEIAPVILREVNIAIMRESFSTGHLIEKEDLKLSPIWMGQEKNNYIVNTDDCCGKELAKKMAAGEILRPADLLDPVCAKRGDLVKIDCKSKNMMVSTMGKALQAGRKGDAIKVENITSKKVFTVQLTGERAGFIGLD